MKICWKDYAKRKLDMSWHRSTSVKSEQHSGHNQFRLLGLPLARFSCFSLQNLNLSTQPITKATIISTQKGSNCSYNSIYPPLRSFPCVTRPPSQIKTKFKTSVWTTFPNVDGPISQPLTYVGLLVCSQQHDYFCRIAPSTENSLESVIPFIFTYTFQK